jgi:hypothetical protein
MVVGGRRDMIWRLRGGRAVGEEEPLLLQRCGVWREDRSPTLQDIHTIPVVVMSLELLSRFRAEMLYWLHIALTRRRWRLAGKGPFKVLVQCYLGIGDGHDLSGVFFHTASRGGYELMTQITPLTSATAISNRLTVSGQH